VPEWNSRDQCQPEEKLYLLENETFSLLGFHLEIHCGIVFARRIGMRAGPRNKPAILYFSKSRGIEYRLMIRFRMSACSGDLSCARVLCVFLIAGAIIRK